MTHPIPRVLQLERAQMLQKAMGTRLAAVYMRNHQWSIEAAILTLCGPESLERHYYLEALSC